MLTKEAVRRWYVIHQWTSLISTVFVLIACITGLPLVFHHEIDHLFGEPAAAVEAADPPTLGELLSNAREARPGMHPQLVSNDPGAPEVTYVAMGGAEERRGLLEGWLGRQAEPQAIGGLGGRCRGQGPGREPRRTRF